MDDNLFIVSDNHNLTKRQLEVLNLVAKGYSTKGIADKLNISYSTTRKHRINILGKLNASNSAHAVAIAKDREII